MALATPYTHRIHKPRQPTAVVPYVSPQTQTYTGSVTAHAQFSKTPGTPSWTRRYPTTSVKFNNKRSKSNHTYYHNYKIYVGHSALASATAPTGNHYGKAHGQHR